MEHIAIDLGGLESQICVRSESGTILKEKRLRTDALAGFFKKRPSSRVVMESSCEAFSIADLAREAGHDVVVMPSAYTPVFTAGSPGKKNDVIDARGLSQASVALEVLPSVHVPSHLSRYRKDVCTTRRLLVRQRTQLCCRLRAFFRANLMGRPRATSKTLGPRARAILGENAPVHIRIVIERLENLTASITSLDKELKELCEQSLECQRLMTVPGVGPVTALAFASAIDESSRFNRGAQVASYLGLTPGEKTTGFRTNRTSITKAGSAAARFALVQAAWAFWRTKPNDPVIKWAEAIAERRGRQIAVVALAAKLARIMFAILRDQKNYLARST